MTVTRSVAAVAISAPKESANLATVPAPVPREHGINGFRELCTARFINTTGVNPRPHVPFVFGNFAEPLGLLETFQVFDLWGHVLHLFECDFILFPSMRKDYIVRRVSIEVLELQSPSVQ